MASTSTAVNSCYQIFLNHRGPDTKHTFTSHLYHRLVLHGFRVFWDKEQMQVGDTLSSQIHEAIKAASLHVAIFSPRYADSTWCLDELVLMLESEKPIIPVFYGVHPTELRHTEGDGDGVFARALCQLKNKRARDSQPRYNSTTIQKWIEALYGLFARALCLQGLLIEPRYNSNTIQKWREALSTAAEISGLELDKFGGDEGELLEKVVHSVLKKLGKTSFDVAEHPTGLDEKIEDFEKSLQISYNALPEDIEKSLQISYNALQRDEKQIFLDVACFFIGKNRDTAIRIWDGSGWKGSLGFRSLQNKNLVEVDSENKIRMHDHLRELGRDLAKNPELPRRIWRTEDFEDLLQQSSETEVRGISIHWTKKEEPPIARCTMRNLQLLDFNCSYGAEHLLESIRNAVQSPNLIWFSCHDSDDSDDADNFDDSDDSDDADNSSPPSWIPLKKLRVLELRGRKLRTLWEEESEAPLQLRELIVEDSARTSLPHWFGNLTNLEHIQLTTSHLEILPDSFGNLTRLKYLHLEGCTILRSITLGTICTLEQLHLSFCKSIEVLPAQLARQQSLEVLHLHHLYKLTELPSDIGELNNLKHLRLERCERLESLPVSLGRLNQLTNLTIRDCDQLREVSFKMVEGERESICPNLQYLEIWKCTNLEEVGTLPDALTTLEVYGCHELRKIEWSSPLSKLQMLNIKECSKVEQLPSLETLVSLEELHTSECRKLRSIRGVAHLPKLRTINVSSCLSLEEVVGVEDLTSLEWIDFDYCFELRLSERLKDLRRYWLSERLKDLRRWM